MGRQGRFWPVGWLVAALVLAGWPAVPLPGALGAPNAGCLRVAGDPANTCYTDLTAALGAVAPGGTITAEAGTYPTVGVTVGKSVTMKGAGSANTIFAGDGANGRVLTVAAGATVSIDGVTIQNGNAGFGGQGGGVFASGATVTISNSAIVGNVAPSGFGGGVFNAGGSLTLTATAVTNNAANNGFGGGVYNENGGTLTLVDSALRQNRADLGLGGGLYQKAGTLTVTNSGIQQNSANVGYGGGAGVAGGTATFSRTFFNNNGAPQGLGGGLYVNGAVVSVSDSTFAFNTADTGYGGGAFNDNGGTLTVATSTFNNNSANTGWGGGLFNDVGGTLVVKTSTVANNSTTSGYGGGIYNDAGASLTLVASTVADNVAVSGGGLFTNGSSATVRSRPRQEPNPRARVALAAGVSSLAGTILQNITGGNCATGGGGTITSFGYSLSDDATCAFGSGNGNADFAPIKLGSLADNGGPTTTIALQTNAGPNAALNRIPPGTVQLGTTLCPPPGQSIADQRGLARPAPAGTNCDVGAYEAAASIGPGPTPTSTPISGGGSNDPVAGNLRLLNPVRVLDTRFGTTVGYAPAGAPLAAGPVPDGGTLRFKVAGQSFGGTAVPADATGVLLNVTIQQPGPSGGFVTLWSGDGAAPNASTVNPATAIAANFTTVALSRQSPNAGSLAVYSAGAVRDVVVDLVGYWSPSNPAGSGNLKLVTPARVLDTRGAGANGTGPVGVSADGSPVGAAPLQPGVTRRFRLGGQSFGGTAFPADVAGILAHVTVQQPTGTGGYVTLLPGDAQGAPGTSTLNPSTPIAFNTAAVGLPTTGGAGAAGTFALYSTNTLDAIVDVVGYWAPGNTLGAPDVVGNPTLVTPGRVLDTRGTAGGPIGFQPNGAPIAAGQLQPGTTTRYLLAGKSFAGGALQLPADVKGVLANATLAQGGPGGGYVTVFPGNAGAVPNASTVNPSTAVAASFWASGVPVAPAANPGTVTVFSNGDPRDVIIDVVAYFR